MCIGDTGDSLDTEEQALLQRKAAASFPAHEFALRSNQDGMIWAVLTPREHSSPLQITICRVDPCILVMLEDRDARRQFRAVPDVENAIDFVHAILVHATSDQSAHACEAPTLH